MPQMDQDHDRSLRHRIVAEAVSVSATTASVTSTTTSIADTDEKVPREATLQKRQNSWKDWAAATLQVSLHDWVLIATMIFGGCCSNVFALEILVK